MIMDEDNFKNCTMCCQPCDDCRLVADWENLNIKASRWKGLDSNSIVYDSVDWEEGSAGLHWHKSCKIEIYGERKL